jgi:hypothetical protein
VGEQHVQHFFAQIDWGAAERERLDALKSFVAGLPAEGFRYECREFPPAAREDFSLCMQIYWNELLDRVHFASVISLLRAKAWFDGMFSGVRDENFHSFAACMRGLIESVGDSCHCLLGVPAQLKSKSSLIARALSGRADIHEHERYLEEELEVRMIHFSHARGTRREEKVPDAAKHRAKHVRDYLDILKDGPAAQLIPVYEQLCDISHPASNSNLPFTLIHRDDEECSIYEVRSDLSFANLVGFSMRHRGVFPVLVEFSIDPPQECLRTLESLRLPRGSE